MLPIADTTVISNFSLVERLDLLGFLIINTNVMVDLQKFPICG